MHSTQFKKSDYLFLFIVFIGFYLLYQYSLFTSDDYYYHFIGGMSGGINGEYIPVNSMGDAIKSQLHDYMHWNGRFLVHALTSYFCGMEYLTLFRVLNSIVFVLLIAGLIKLIRLEFEYNSTDKYIILFLLFVLMPEPGYIFLGHIAATINYLWTSCAIIYFLILYNKIKDKKYSIGINIIFLFIGIIIGSLQESFTIGISGALFIYYCFHIRQFRNSPAWLVAGFWLGTCIVTLAPGNFERLQNAYLINTQKTGLIGLIKYASQFAHLLFDSKILLTCIIISVISYIKNKEFTKKIIQKNYLYYLSILLNGAIVTIVYTGVRQLTCIELFSMIILIKLIYSYATESIKQKSKIINIALNAILIFMYIPIIQNRKFYSTIYTNLQNKEPHNGIIIDKDFIEKSRNVAEETFISKYINTINYNTLFHKEGLSLWKTNGTNLNAITAILPISPEEIQQKFNENSKQIYIYDQENNCYYFKCPQDKVINNVYFIAQPTTILGRIRNTLFNKGFNKFLRDGDMGYFQYAGYNYYIDIKKDKDLNILKYEYTIK